VIAASLAHLDPSTLPVGLRLPSGCS
jgi:hypothetical protein